MVGVAKWLYWGKLLLAGGCVGLGVGILVSVILPSLEYSVPKSTVHDYLIKEWNSALGGSLADWRYPWESIEHEEDVLAYIPNHDRPNVPDHDQTDLDFAGVDRALKKLQHGRAAIFPQRERMRVGESIQVAVSVGKRLSETKFTEDIKNALHNEHIDRSNIGFQELKVTPIMEAELSGPGFNIGPKAEQVIEISSTTPGTAVWTITALPGDDLGYQLSARRTVHVTVYALIEVAGKERPRRVDSLDHDIIIDVGPVEWFMHTEELVEKGGWVIASCVGAGGGLGGLYGWLRRRKRRAKGEAEAT